MDESSKEKLIEQFRTYLDQYELNQTETPEQTDLFSLFTELAALRNEIRLESRQLKTALDMFRESFELVQNSNEQLTQELERCRKEQRTKERESTRVLLLAFLEIYDRLDAGLKTLRRYKQSSWGFFCQPEIRLISGITEGQAMTLRRVTQLLARYQVRPMDVRNKLLDPHTMRAVEVESDHRLRNGIVTEELRKGFMWDQEVLRIAEVKVNKK